MYAAQNSGIESLSRASGSSSYQVVYPFLSPHGSHSSEGPILSLPLLSLLFPPLLLSLWESIQRREPYWADRVTVGPGTKLHCTPRPVLGGPSGSLSKQEALGINPILSEWRRYALGREPFENSPFL